MLEIYSLIAVISNLCNPTSSNNPASITQRFIPVALPWNSSNSSIAFAESYCHRSYGTHLASIYTISDLQEAKSVCEDSGFWYCFIGLNDIQSEDQWVFTSGAMYNEQVEDWYDDWYYDPGIYKWRYR